MGEEVDNGDGAVGGGAHNGGTICALKVGLHDLVVLAITVRGEVCVRVDRGA